MTAAGFDVVVPTVGRPELYRLLASLDDCAPPWPAQVILVDDRPIGDRVNPLAAGCGIGCPVRVVTTAGGCGPAVARNAGWQASSADWIVFLDDDVHVTAGWSEQLMADLAGAADDVGAVRAVIDVPLPARPTDWERNVGRLATADGITADLATRRAALADVGGFDERFPRAYREDSDFFLRLGARGWRSAQGGRRTRHPVRPADPWISVRLQRGNADDVLMERIHGPRWRQAIGEPAGRMGFHRAVVGAEIVAVGAAVAGWRRAAPLAALAAVSLTAWFAASRIRPGPRTWREVRTMALTSAVIPPVALWHRLRGRLRYPVPVPPWPTVRRRVGSACSA